MDNENDFNSMAGVHFQNQSGGPVSLDKQSLREAGEKLSTRFNEGFVSDEDWVRIERIKGLAELFDNVLFWCWHVKVGGVYKLRKYRAAQNRFVAMTALIKPEIFNHDSYESIAGKIGTTKALLSLYAKEFQTDVAGLKFQRSKKDGDSHSVSAKKTWQERKASK